MVVLLSSFWIIVMVLIIIFSFEIMTYIMHDNLWYTAIVFGFWPILFILHGFFEMWVKEDDERREKLKKKRILEQRKRV